MPNVEQETPFQKVLQEIGVTQNELAAMTRPMVSLSSINAYAVGRRSPTLKKAQVIAQVLNRRVEELFPMRVGGG